MVGYRAIQDLQPYWFSPSADVRQARIPRAFVQEMQLEMRTDFGVFDYDPIPGARVTTGINPTSPNVIPKKAVYINIWSIFNKG